VSVALGVDPALVADLRGLPLLDRSVDAPQPRRSAPRPPTGAVVEVELRASQEGVTYQLLDAAAITPASSRAPPSSAPPGAIRPAHRPALRGPGAARPRQQGRRRPGINPSCAARSSTPSSLAADRGPTQPSPPELLPAAILPPRRRARPAPARQPTERPLPRLSAADSADGEFLFNDPQGAPTLDLQPDDGPPIRVPAARHHPLGGAPAGSVKPRQGPRRPPRYPPCPRPERTACWSSMPTRATVAARRRRGHHTFTSIVQLDPTLALLGQPDARRLPSRCTSPSPKPARSAPAPCSAGGQPGVFYQLYQLPDARRDRPARRLPQAATDLGPAQQRRHRSAPRRGRPRSSYRPRPLAPRPRPPSTAHAHRARSARRRRRPLPLIDAAPLPFGAVLRVHARRGRHQPRDSLRLRAHRAPRPSIPPLNSSSSPRASPPAAPLRS
jgi:hypothetical protein